MSDRRRTYGNQSSDGPIYGKVILPCLSLESTYAYIGYLDESSRSFKRGAKFPRKVTVNNPDRPSANKFIIYANHICLCNEFMYITYACTEDSNYSSRYIYLCIEKINMKSVNLLDSSIDLSNYSTRVYMESISTTYYCNTMGYLNTIWDYSKDKLYIAYTKDDGSYNYGKRNCWINIDTGKYENAYYDDASDREEARDFSNVNLYSTSNGLVSITMDRSSDYTEVYYKDDSRYKNISPWILQSRHTPTLGLCSETKVMYSNAWDYDDYYHDLICDINGGYDTIYSGSNSSSNIGSCVIVMDNSRYIDFKKNIYSTMYIKDNTMYTMEGNSHSVTINGSLTRYGMYKLGEVFISRQTPESLYSGSVLVSFDNGYTFNTVNSSSEIPSINAYFYYQNSGIQYILI